jgi:hypothetical protein
MLHLGFGDSGSGELGRNCSGVNESNRLFATIIRVRRAPGTIARLQGEQYDGLTYSHDSYGQVDNHACLRAAPDTERPCLRPCGR